MQSTLASLKSRGVVTVKRKYLSDDGNFDSRLYKYLGKSKSYVLQGFSNSGKKIAELHPLRSTKEPAAFRLISFVNDECNLSGFNLFNPSTWFAKDCELKSAPVDSYIAASLWEAHVQQDSSTLIYLIQARWMQLLGVIGNQGPYTITDNVFSSQFNLASYATDHFPLKETAIAGGYEFKLNGEGPGTLTYLAPDYSKLAKVAKISKDGIRLVFPSLN